MKKYLIVDTWNGEGYSDSSAHIKTIDPQDDQHIDEYAEDLAESFILGGGEDSSLEKIGNRYQYIIGEDSGSVHFIELPENLLAVAILPCINSYEIITSDQELSDIVKMIMDSDEFEDNADGVVYGPCHPYAYGEDDIILMHRVHILERVLEPNSTDSEKLEEILKVLRPLVSKMKGNVNRLWLPSLEHTLECIVLEDTEYLDDPDDESTEIVTSGADIMDLVVRLKEFL